MGFYGSTIFYISYLATKNGINTYGSLKGTFASCPPRFDEVLDMQTIIKEEYGFDEVLILGWQKLGDKEI